MEVGNLFRQFVSNNNRMSEGRGAAPTSGKQQAQALNRTMQTINSLQKGQTFEGNVSSIKGDKVTLSLSNGSSVVARLSDDVSLSEGESVFFEVKSNDGNLINIRPISIGMMANPTILSALDAGGLAQNERNVQLVNEMMQEQLPIDSKNLGEMAKQAALHPGTDIGTLVTMEKVGLPLTDEMIEQFENYKESEGAILDTVNELTDALAEAFTGPDVSSQDVATFTKNLMSILTTEDGIIPQLSDAEGNLVLLTGDEDAVPVEAEEAGISGEEAAAAEETESGEAVDGETVMSEGAAATVEGAGEEAASPTTNIESLMARFEAAEAKLRGKGVSLDDTLIMPKDVAAEAEAENTAAPKAGSTETGALESTKTADAGATETENVARFSKETGIVIESADNDPDIQRILQNTPGEDEVSLPNTLGRVLDSGEQKELSALLKDLGMSAESLVDEEGNLRPETETKELAQAISEYLSENPNLSKDDMIKMLSADPFKKILKDVMSQKWTLPPEKVADKQAVKDLYAKLSVDMDRLSKVASEAAKGQNPISASAQSIQNNVDFINQINQAYTYIQLPLKLAGQQATGDLYVYSNKKGPIGENDELSAFLHFDLEHLGSTDISVKMKQKKVSTNFYMDDEVSFNLIEKNLPVLQEKLEKLGYSVTIKASKGDEPVDFVEDFLKQDVAFGGDIRRYSFDMMA